MRSGGKMFPAKEEIRTVGVWALQWMRRRRGSISSVTLLGWRGNNREPEAGKRQVMVPQRAGSEVTESWGGLSTSEVNVHTNP